MVKLKCVDFFCGGGGMSAGMRDADIGVVAAIDNDPDCEATYRANHADTAFIAEDITAMSEKTLAQAGVKRRDDNMVFIGCSPCQYWSVITGAKGTERKKKAHKARNLLGDFLRFVEYFEPGFVVVENVRGIQSNLRESKLGKLLNFFEENGYAYSHGVHSAAHYGVPQTRMRYLLLASRVTKKIALPPHGKKVKTVRDAIGEGRLPEIKAGEQARGDSLHRASWLSPENIKRLRLTPEGGKREYWASRPELLIDAYRGKPTSFFSDNYGRMSWDKPAPAITTKFFSLGCGRFGHPEQNRAISLREGAMLQTFKKNYIFKDKTFRVTARLIGNAVPPTLAKHIGLAIVKAHKARRA